MFLNFRDIVITIVININNTNIISFILKIGLIMNLIVSLLKRCLKWINWSCKIIINKNNVPNRTRIGNNKQNFLSNKNVWKVRIKESISQFLL